MTKSTELPKPGPTRANCLGPTRFQNGIGPWPSELGTQRSVVLALQRAQEVQDVLFLGRAKRIEVVDNSIGLRAAEECR